MKYQILSPDGFSINLAGGFKTLKEANAYFNKWRDAYKAQGYYSQTCYNGYRRQIELNELKDYCTFVKN